MLILTFISYHVNRKCSYFLWSLPFSNYFVPKGRLFPAFGLIISTLQALFQFRGQIFSCSQPDFFFPSDSISAQRVDFFLLSGCFFCPQQPISPLRGRLNLQCPEVFLLPRRNTIALHRLLDGFVMGPYIQPLLLQHFYSCLILLCQSGGKIPGPHHVHIIFL